MQCGFTHMSMDDPIVYPSQPGMGHMHAFYGNKSTDAYSTRASLLAAGTTCTDKKDKAAIWAPTAFIKKNGSWRPLEPYRERTYYFRAIRQQIAPVTSLPANIKLIGGNPHATSRADNPALRWYCGEGSPERPYPYDCRPYTAKGEDGIRAIIDLPFCWDGTNLDSADHFSHVIYSDPNDTTPACRAEAMSGVAPEVPARGLDPDPLPHPGSVRRRDPVRSGRRRRERPDQAVERPLLHDARGLLEHVGAVAAGDADRQLHPRLEGLPHHRRDHDRHLIRRSGEGTARRARRARA